MKTFLASILFLPFAVIAEDTNDLPPLAPACPVIQPTFWEQHGTMVLIGGFGLLVVLVLGLWLLLKPGPPVVPLPADVARKALRKLQHQPEDGRLLSEVSQILKRYMGAVFGFSAGEMTTTEFSAALAADVKAGQQVAEVVTTFLRGCDKAKFTAKITAPPLDAVSRALEIVANIENEQKIGGSKT
jgi:hypothetical protein